MTTSASCPAGHTCERAKRTFQACLLLACSAETVSRTRIRGVLGHGLFLAVAAEEIGDEVRLGSAEWWAQIARSREHALRLRAPGGDRAPRLSSFAEDEAEEHIEAPYSEEEERRN